MSRSIPLILSVLAVLISGVSLYYSHFRKSSELLAFVSEISPLFKPEGVEYSNHFAWINLGYRVKMALENNGNQPSLLLKMFSTVPNAKDVDCKDFNLERFGSISADIFGVENFAGVTAFQGTPVVVPPSGLVTVEATLPPRRVGRPESEFGEKVTCLVFIAINHSGQLFVTSVPSINIFISKDKTVGYSGEIANPIDLLRMENKMVVERSSR